MSNEVNDQVENLRVKDVRSFKKLTGRRSPCKNKDARANDRSDPQRGKTPRPEALFQPMFRLFRFSDQFVDRFAGKELPARALVSIGRGLWFQTWDLWSGMFGQF